MSNIIYYDLYYKINDIDGLIMERYEDKIQCSEAYEDLNRRYEIESIFIEVYTKDKDIYDSIDT